MTYNVTIVGRGFVPVMQKANQIVGGIMGIGFLLLIFMIFFMLTKNYSTKRAIFTASFFTALCAVLFRIMEIVNDTTLYVCFALLILSLIWNYFQD